MPEPVPPPSACTTWKPCSASHSCGGVEGEVEGSQEMGVGEANNNKINETKTKTGKIFPIFFAKNRKGEKTQQFLCRCFLVLSHLHLSAHGVHGLLHQRGALAVEPARPVVAAA